MIEVTDAILCGIVGLLLHLEYRIGRYESFSVSLSGALNECRVRLGLDRFEGGI